MDKEQAKLIDFIRINLLKKKSVRINPSTLLFKEKVIDSINILNLIGYVEKKLERRLTDEEIVMSNFQSVESITNAFLNENKR